MCTRYYYDRNTKELEEIALDAERSPLVLRFAQAGNPLVTEGEIRPSNVVPVIAPGKNGQMACFPMKWGFQIPGRALLINARAETASEKPTFRKAWERHRCVIPASWYFEWKHFTGNNGQKKTGSKYRIKPKDSGITWLLGLYRIEDGFPCFTVLTREPAEDLRKIHDRMPLILPGDKVDKWIRPGSRPEEMLPYALTDMYAEKAE